MQYLIDAFPGLARNVPFLPLVHAPTPVIAADGLLAPGKDRIFIKRDDISGALYGGNKVRKLALLLAEPRVERASTLLTFGYAGSNHTTATAIYGHARNLQVYALVARQPNAQYVRDNLLRQLRVGAHLRHYKNLATLSLTAPVRWTLASLAARERAVIFAPGGTSPASCAGYVDAAFELAAQVEAGLLPEPDMLYVPLGTMGTAAGLIAGLQAAGLRTRVRAVAVVAPRYSRRQALARLVRRTISWIRRRDGSFPSRPAPFSIERGFFGSGYAAFTDAGREAVGLANRSIGLQLDGTYSGKTLAAMLADSLAGNLAGKTALFWLTYNGLPLPPEVRAQDYRALPPAFHSYFETPVQKLV